MKRTEEKIIQIIRTMRNSKITQQQVMTLVVVLLALLALLVNGKLSKSPLEQAKMVGPTKEVQEIEEEESAEIKIYSINNACESYRPLVKEMALRYDMGQYVDLIMAVIMQESAGRGSDVMQSSEGAYNERYPKVPDGITDVKYSIECGIQELKEAINRVGVTGPDDIDGICQALQAYNFGLNYLAYVEDEGVEGWDEKTVAAFAEIASCGKTRSTSETESMGKWDYGDQKYPEHVLRYYAPAAK